MAENRRITPQLADHLELLGITQMVLQDITHINNPGPYGTGLTKIKMQDDGLISDVEYNGVSVFEYVEKTRPKKVVIPYGKSPLEELIKKHFNGFK